MFEKSYTPKNKCFFRFWNLWGCHIDLDMRECYTLYIYSISVRDCYFSYLKCLLALEKKAFCMPRTHSPPKPKNNQDSTILLDSILVFSFWYTHVRDRWEHDSKTKIQFKSLVESWFMVSWFWGMPAHASRLHHPTAIGYARWECSPSYARTWTPEERRRRWRWRWGRRNGQRWNRPAS